MATSAITRWKKEEHPNTLLAIDPGASWPGGARKEHVPYAGCALFQWGQLAWAGLVKCPAKVMVDGVTTNIPAFARPNLLVRRVCEEANVARHGGKRDGGGKICGKCGRGGHTELGEGVTVLVVENPSIWKGTEARPQDIMALKAIYGAFMGGIDADFYSGPSPADVKANIDKVTMNERTLAVLSVEERRLLKEQQKNGNGGLSDHVLDGVGAGLWVLGRMGTGGVV